MKSEPKSLLPKQRLSRKLPSRWDTQLDTQFSDLSLLPMFERGARRNEGESTQNSQVDLPKDQARLRLFPERTTLSERYMLDNMVGDPISAHAELAELLHAQVSQGFALGKCWGTAGIPWDPMGTIPGPCIIWPWSPGCPCHPSIWCIQLGPFLSDAKLGYKPSFRKRSLRTALITSFPNCSSDAISSKRAWSTSDSSTLCLLCLALWVSSQVLIIRVSKARISPENSLLDTQNPQLPGKFWPTISCHQLLHQLLLDLRPSLLQILLDFSIIGLEVHGIRLVVKPHL